VTVCGRSSLLVQVTDPPEAMVTLPGLKLELTMFTLSEDGAACVDVAPELAVPEVPVVAVELPPLEPDWLPPAVTVP
jgi:hypothetical protein